MNAFLKDLAITFRRDPTNHRPRINKMGSVKDKEQKLAGSFFYLDTGHTTSTNNEGWTEQWS
jgi:ATP-binding cassette subfamily E protein 1